MRRSTFSIAVAAIGMVAASCEAPPVYDRAALLHDAAFDVIVPAYDALDARAGTLETATGALCAAPDEPGLAAAQAAWQDAFLAFETSAAYGIGPARERNLAAEMGFWPTSPDAIERNVAASTTIDAAWVDALGAGSKGFFALAYLLYGGTPDVAWTPPAPSAVVTALGAPRRCAYAVALAAHVHRTTSALAAAWHDGYAEVLATAGEPGNAEWPDRSTALVALLTQLLDTLKTLKNTKLGIPIGHRTAMPSPTAIESPFADVGVAAMRANLDGAVALWSGGAHSFAGMLEARDPALAMRVDGELAAAQAGLAALAAVAEQGDTTFGAYAAGADHSVGEAAYARVDEAETTIATDVASRFGLGIAFSDMDGD